SLTAIDETTAGGWSRVVAVVCLAHIRSTDPPARVGLARARRCLRASRTGCGGDEDPRRAGIPAQNETAGARRLRRSTSELGRRSDRRADLRQDRADLGAQEDQRDDRDDRDEGEDQRVLGETLAFLVPAKRGEELMNERH